MTARSRIRQEAVLGTGIGPSLLQPIGLGALRHRDPARPDAAATASCRSIIGLCSCILSHEPPFRLALLILTGCRHGAARPLPSPSLRADRIGQSWLAESRRQLSGSDSSVTVVGREGVPPFDLRSAEHRSPTATGLALDRERAWRSRSALLGRELLSTPPARRRREVALCLSPTAKPSPANRRSWRRPLCLSKSRLDDLRSTAFRIGESRSREPATLVLAATPGSMPSHTAHLSLDASMHSPVSANLMLTLAERPALLDLDSEVSEPTGLLMDRSSSARSRAAQYYCNGSDPSTTGRKLTAVPARYSLCRPPRHCPERWLAPTAPRRGNRLVAGANIEPGVADHLTWLCSARCRATSFFPWNTRRNDRRGAVSRRGGSIRIFAAITVAAPRGVPIGPCRRLVGARHLRTDSPRLLARGSVQRPPAALSLVGARRAQTPCRRRPARICASRLHRSARGGLW